MAVQTTNNKPINPRGNDQSPKGYNRASLFSGKALDFDGVNDSIQVTTIGSVFDYGNAYTMAGYFKIVDAGSGVLMGNNNGNGFANLLGLIYKNGADSNFYPDGNSSNYVTIYSGNTTDFVHIVCTSDGTTAKAYLNGQLVGSTSVSSYTNTSSVFNVGSSLSGNFGESESAGVKVYSTALTAAQVSDLYNNPEKIVPTGVSNDALKLWLPMMEGAGTTAYDGSGNGNHGTISGATYVNGVGAPVSQTAVIDWNKGTNLLTYSEQFNQWTTNVACTITANDTTAPNGTTTADLIKSNNNVTNYVGEFVSHSASTEYVYSCYVKNNDSTLIRLQVYDGAMYHNLEFDGSFTNEASFNLSDYTIESVGDGWYYVSLEYTSNPSATGGFLQVYPDRSGAFKSVFVWGASFEQASTAGPYVRTGATAQTSPVLLPQGLTSGRDITGVNLFENVRKQGALNLDGNSWAEVHDNASLDVTDAITLEAWVYAGSGTDNGVLGKWYYTTNKKSYIIYQAGINSFRFYTSSDGDNNAYAAVTTSSGWNHLVGVDDGTNLKFYVNGSEEASVASLGSIYASDQNLKIGNMVLTSQSFPNPIAQPRIYNRALTTEEVERNYNAGKNTYKN